MKKRNKLGQFKHSPKTGGLYLLIACTIGAAGLHYGSKVSEKITKHYELSQVCQELVSPIPKKPFFEIAQVQAEEIKKEEIVVECTTEKCHIKDYLKEKFQDRYEDALKMLETCENSTLNPRIVSPLNIQKSGRRSYDVGVMQINVDENNKAEIERLKDFKYNIDQGYKKYKAKNNTFYAWTCGHVTGDRTYADNY